MRSCTTESSFSPRLSSIPSSFWAWGTVRGKPSNTKLKGKDASVVLKQLDAQGEEKTDETPRRFPSEQRAESTSFRYQELGRNLGRLPCNV